MEYLQDYLPNAEMRKIKTTIVTIRSSSWTNVDFQRSHSIARRCRMFDFVFFRQETFRRGSLGISCVCVTHLVSREHFHANYAGQANEWKRTMELNSSLLFFSFSFLPSSRSLPLSFVPLSLSSSRDEIAAATTTKKESRKRWRHEYEYVNNTKLKQKEQIDRHRQSFIA